MATKRRDNYELDMHIKKLKELGSGRSQATLNRKLGMAYASYVDERFETKTAPGNRRWKPRTRHYSWPLLEDTGDLRSAFKRGNVKWSARGFQITVPGYGMYHQEGTRNMVARRFMPSGIPAELKVEWEEIVADHVRKRLANK